MKRTKRSLLEAIHDMLVEALALQRASARRERQMANDLKAIETEVAANTSATDSAVVLLDSLAQMLEDAKDDPAAVQRLADDLRGNSTRLGEAVTRNTPQGPTQPPQQPLRTQP